MKHTNIVSIILFAVMLASLPVSMARAVESSNALVTGTIQSLVLETDELTSITTMVVFFKDEAGVGQMARISLETAISLQLLIPNPESIGQVIDLPDPLNPELTISGTITALAFVTDPVTLITTLEVTLTAMDSSVQVVALDLVNAMTLNLIVVNEAMLGQPFQVDSSLILESDTYSDKVTMLFTVFGTALSITPDQLAAYVEAGTGIGVLAQALWMTSSLGGDAALLDLIITAKSTSDFSAIVLPDGTTPANWGQLRKAVLTSPRQNLGQIVSGKVEPLPAPTTVSPTNTVTDPGKSAGKSDEEHGKSGDKGKNK